MPLWRWQAAPAPGKNKASRQTGGRRLTVEPAKRSASASLHDRPRLAHYWLNRATPYCDRNHIQLPQGSARDRSSAPPRAQLDRGDRRQRLSHKSCCSNRDGAGQAFPAARSVGADTKWLACPQECFPEPRAKTDASTRPRQAIRRQGADRQDQALVPKPVPRVEPEIRGAGQRRPGRHVNATLTLTPPPAEIRRAQVKDDETSLDCSRSARGWDDVKTMRASRN